MHTINIFENTSIESILGFIENEIEKYQTKYILISFQDEMRSMDRKKTVEIIKKYFDIFLLLQSEIPNNKQRIEEYFSYGVHGIYFDKNCNIFSNQQIEIMGFAADLFMPGWVFVNADNKKTMIEELLYLKIIPVLSEDNNKLLDFIKSHEAFHKISPNLLRKIPLIDQGPCEYSLADKIKMKMLLETLNLRQKLMIKSIDDSFNSSGL